MSQNPLERVIKQLEKKTEELVISARTEIASQINIPGLRFAIETCQRILEESKPCEPKLVKWEISKVMTTSLGDKDIQSHLDTGYEPFAVSDGVIYFKRPVCDK